MLFVVISSHQIFTGAVVMSLFNRFNDRVAFMVAYGGDFITNEDNFIQLKEHLKIAGATCIEGSVRESMQRLTRKLGFKRKSINIKYEL